MVEYVTRANLRTMLSDAADGRIRVAKAAQRDPKGATFLSHSSKDDDLMPAVVTILENHGATVYIDKRDPHLSTQAPRDIAASLRTNISAASKFVVFVSDNTKTSKWVPWELGLADGCKHNSKVAVFPAIENTHENSWTEQEYLGIYDRIVWGKITGDTNFGWLVWDFNNNSASHLREWIAK